MIDLHNHILPGVDDGSSSFEESLEMARCAVRDGIDTIVCTPHMNAEMDELSLLHEHGGLREQLQQRLQEEHISLRLLSGAEWMLTPNLLSVVCESGRLGESSAFLFELSPFMPVFAAENMIKEARRIGLKPVLAHPERYPMLGEENYLSLGALVKEGCLLQLTSGSLLGDFGKRAKLLGIKIAKSFPENIVIASDAHHSTVRKPLLREGYAVLENISSGFAERVQTKLTTLLRSE